MLKRLWVIIHKELLDNMRDRRSVGNALFTVLLNPLIYIVLFGFMNRAFSEQIDRPLELHISGAQYAPNLIRFLEQNNVNILEAPEDAETAVRRGDLAAVLIIPEAFSEQFSRGEPAQVQLLVDETSQSGRIAR